MSKLAEQIENAQKAIDLRSNRMDEIHKEWSDGRFPCCLGCYSAEYRALAAKQNRAAEWLGIQLAKRGGVGDVERAKRLARDYDAKGITNFIAKQNRQADCRRKVPKANIEETKGGLGLSVWTDGEDLVVARTIEEAQKAQREVFGDEFELKPLSSWKPIDGAQLICIWPDLLREMQPEIATAMEWVCRNGPRPQLLATCELGGEPAWELV